jgi:hypothetical protein
VGATTTYNDTTIDLELEEQVLSYQSGDCVFASCPAISCTIDRATNEGTCVQADSAEPISVQLDADNQTVNINFYGLNQDQCNISYNVQTGTVCGMDGPDLYCFPGDATVQLKDKSFKMMSDLEIGDQVLVAPDTYSEVYMFSHRHHDVLATFVKLSTESGHVLHLTSNHYLYVNQRLTAARAVQVGDVVLTAAGAETRVANISTVSKRGLYNPHTLQGDVVVNGIQTSTYTASVAPTLAHLVLWPVRLLYSLGVDIFNGVFDQGSLLIGSMAPRGAEVY